MEILIKEEVVQKENLIYLTDEANQILKIAAASRKTISGE